MGYYLVELKYWENIFKYGEHRISENNVDGMFFVIMDIFNIETHSVSKDAFSQFERSSHALIETLGVFLLETVNQKLHFGT